MPRALVPEDLWKARTPSSLAVSPDGRHLAFCMTEPAPDEGKNFSHVYMVAAGARQADPVPLTRGRHQNTQPRWWPDGQSLAFVSDRKEPKGLWRIALAGGEPEPLTQLEGEVQDFEIAPDGRWLLLRIQEPKEPRRREAEKVKKDSYTQGQEWQWTHLFRYDLDSKKLKRLTRGRRDVAAASLSPNGQWVAYIAADDPTFDGRYFHSKLVLLNLRSGRRREVQADSSRIWFADRPSWSPDSRQVAFSASAARDMPFGQTVWVASVADGRARRVRPDLDRHHYSPEFTKGGDLHLIVVDSVDARLVRCARTGQPRALSPGEGVVANHAAGPDGTAYFQHGRSAAAPEIYAVRSPGGRPRQVTRVNRPFAKIRVRPARRIRYRVDDLTIEALLKVPDGKGPWPLILHPHGGPQSVTLDSFQPHHELFLERGYALLMPNFRGSAGRGWAFLQRILGDWGHGPMRDLLAGVDWCVARGIADPDRLGMYGGSYGGYITTWTIGHTKRFRAAVAQCAVTDHVSMYGTTDIPTFMEYNLTGPPHKHFEKWWEQSPVAHVGQVRTPTLILTGLVDERVHPTQSSEYYRHLKATGTKCELVLYPREAHSIAEPHHLLDQFARVLDWFDRYVKGRKPRRAR